MSLFVFFCFFLLLLVVGENEDSELNWQSLSALNVCHYFGDTLNTQPTNGTQQGQLLESAGLTCPDPKELVYLSGLFLS